MQAHRQTRNFQYLANETLTKPRYVKRFKFMADVKSIHLLVRLGLDWLEKAIGSNFSGD